MMTGRPVEMAAGRAGTAAAGSAAELRPRLGIGLMCLAVLCLALMDAIAKWLGGDYPLGQIVWARYAFNLLGLLLLLPALPVAVWRSHRPALQLARGALMVLATALMFLSVRLMPLAETYAIAFTAPLIVALLAGLTLGERVGLRRWLAIGLGFVGVLVVIRPGAGVLGAAALVPLGMAVAYAGYQLVTRRLAPLDHAFVTMFWSAAIGVVGASFLLPLGWRPPDAAGWGLMVAMGLLGLAGQLAMIRAFAMAAAPVLAPYGYTQILWAVTLGYLAFGDLPDRWTLIGSAVVVAGGAWLFVQERRTVGA